MTTEPTRKPPSETGTEKNGRVIRQGLVISGLILWGIFAVWWGVAGAEARPDWLGYALTLLTLMLAYEAWLLGVEAWKRWRGQGDA